MSSVRSTIAATPHGSLPNSQAFAFLRPGQRTDTARGSAQVVVCRTLDEAEAMKSDLQAGASRAGGAPRGTGLLVRRRDDTDGGLDQEFLEVWRFDW